MVIIRTSAVAVSIQAVSPESSIGVLRPGARGRKQRRRPADQADRAAAPRPIPSATAA